MRIFLEKPFVVQLVKTFPASYRTWRIFIISASLHWALFWSSWMQSTPSHPIHL